MNPEVKPPQLQAKKAPIPQKVIWTIVGLVLTFSILLFYAVEGWRGQRAWRAYRASVEAQGRSLNWDAYIPAPVPDNDNFALNPWLRPILDFVPGTQTLKIPTSEAPVFQAFNAANALSMAKGYNYKAGIPDGRQWWTVGLTVDLFQLLGTNLPAKNGAAPKAVNPERDLAAQTNAARLIREIQQPDIDPLLDELRAASRKSVCRFPVQYNTAPLYSTLLPHENAVKSLCDHATRRAEARLVLGESGPAFEDLVLALYLSDTLRGEPFVISDQVRHASRQYATQVIYDALAMHAWPDAQVKQLLNGLRKDDFLADARHVLQATPAGDIRLIDQARQGLNGLAIDDLILMGGEMRNSPFTPCAWLFPSGWLDLEQVEIGKKYDRLLSILDKNSTTSLADRQKAVESWLQPSPDSFVRTLFQHRLLVRTWLISSTYFQKIFRAHTVNQMTILACALELHYLAKGDFPDQLDGLTPQILDSIPLDPMSNQPFNYEKTGPHHYLLYSVGADGIDDGGQVAKGKDGRANIQQGDWAWKM